MSYQIWHHTYFTDVHSSLSNSVYAVVPLQLPIFIWHRALMQAIASMHHDDSQERVALPGIYPRTLAVTQLHAGSWKGLAASVYSLRGTLLKRDTQAISLHRVWYRLWQWYHAQNHCIWCWVGMISQLALENHSFLTWSKHLESCTPGQDLAKLYVSVRTGTCQYMTVHDSTIISHLY